MTEKLKSFQILGNSAGIPTEDRAVSAAVISTDRQDILIDCGENTYLNWKTAGYKWRRNSVLLITHLHPDHVGGLLPLLFYRKLLNIDASLDIYGPAELEAYILSSMNYTGVAIDMNLSFHAVSDGMEIELGGGLSCEVAELDHKLPCFGYRIEDAVGTCFSFVTDTRPCAGSRLLARNANVLIHEATFEHDLRELANKTFHTTTVQAMDLAEAANVQQLCLTHFSPRIPDQSLSRLVYNGTFAVPGGKVLFNEPKELSE